MAEDNLIAAVHRADSRVLGSVKVFEPGEKFMTMGKKGEAKLWLVKDTGEIEQVF